MQQQERQHRDVAARVPEPTHAQQQQDIVRVLHDAATRGDAAALQKLLSQGAPVNAREASRGDTVLHTAARMHVEAVKVLLAHGATVDAQNADGFTPLEAAVLCKFQEVVEVLLDAGAAVDGKGSGSLLCASATQNASIVRLLLSRGANPNRHVGNNSLLAMAVMQSTPEVVEMLLQAGAVGRVHPGRGYCDALWAASLINRPDMLRLLLKHTKQHTPEGLRGLLRWAFAQHNQSITAQLLLQLELEQHSAADAFSSGLGEQQHDSSALGMAVLKGWASDTAAVDAGHAAAAAHEQEVAAQRAGVCELAVGFGAAAAACADGARGKQVVDGVQRVQ